MLDKMPQNDLPSNPFKNSDLVPCVVQSVLDQSVLMVACLNEEAYKQTLKTGTLTFFSRSRQALWVKGETSGHTLTLYDLSWDCDQDALLAKVLPKGPTCHLNQASCFDGGLIDQWQVKEPESQTYETLNTLWRVIERRMKKDDPSESSYTQYLKASGLDKILKKVGEECSEVIIASKNDSIEALHEEVADLLYHLYVLLAFKNQTPQGFLDVLKDRLNQKTQEDG